MRRRRRRRKGGKRRFRHLKRIDRIEKI